MIEVLMDCLQWLYMIVGVFGCYFVVKKQRIGWLVWLISTPIAITVFIYKHMLPFVPVFIIYGYLDWKGWKEWKNEK